MARILVVEDSPEAIELIRLALSRDSLQIATTLEQARENLSCGSTYDLVLLDLNLPDGDGLSLASQFSNAGLTEVPIIFLSGRTDIRDKMAAFALGAEDFIEKPFDVMELQARVTARLRRIAAQSNEERVIEVEGLRIEVEQMRVYACEGDVRTELDLSPTEHKLIQLLAKRPGTVLSREQLISSVWGDTIVGTRTVDSHMSHLRSKIRPTRTRIECVRGMGYRLSAA